MPEIVMEEMEYIIFAGLLQDLQAKFIVSRMVDSQITFRILHPNLHVVQKSAEKILKKIINTKFFEKPLRVSNDDVFIFERGFSSIIITGKVIISPLRETFRRNRKDLVLLLISILILLPAVITLLVSNSSLSIMSSTAKELITASLAVIAVSLFGILQTYVETFIETYYDKIITWKVSEIYD